MIYVFSAAIGMPPATPYYIQFGHSCFVLGLVACSYFAQQVWQQLLAARFCQIAAQLLKIRA